MPQYIDYGDMQRERAEIVKGAKNLALKRREKSPYAIEKQGEFIEKINAYIEKQELEKKPLTIAGFILATGIPKVSWVIHLSLLVYTNGCVPNWIIIILHHGIMRG